MNLKNFFSLYWRNIKGTFFNGFVEPITYIGPLIWLGHIVLLPLTLTIGAGIKTFIDFFTRKPMPDESIKAKQNEIKSLDDQQIEELTKNISSYNPHSNSSRMLLNQLAQLTIDERLVAEREYAIEKRRLVLDQLGPNAEQKYLASYIADVSLDVRHKEILKNYDAQNKAHLAEQKLTAQKNVICSYLGDKKNNGKKLMQVILGLFSPAVEKKFERDIYEQPSGIKFTPFSHGN